MSSVIKMQQVLLGVTADGILGPNTRAALKSRPSIAALSSELAVIVAKVETSNDLTSNWVSIQRVRTYALAASLATKLPLDTLLWMINLEAERKLIGGVPHYNATAISHTGRHKGIGQLYDRAWIDAERYRLRARIKPPLGTFNSNWSNPRLSILALACYSRASEAFAKAIRPELVMTDNLRYAIYNQGAGFVTNTLKGDTVYLGRQSSQARDIARQARADVLRTT